MRSAREAFAWELRHKHRAGFTAALIYVVLLAAIKAFVLARGITIQFHDAQTFALVVVTPLTTASLYFMAVFSFGLSGDLAGRQSIYPARMFTLPVTTDALVFWPMLYGCAAMALLWLAARSLGLWPSDAEVAILWPALLGPSLIAWTQALTWLAYPLPGLRALVTIVWLTVIDAIVMIALELKPSESAMIALLAPHVPLAYLTARFAVARARRGDVPDWRTFLRPFARIARVISPTRDFSSPAAAQMWFEWRLHGRSLPWLVAAVLPFELALLFVFPETPPIILEMVILALTTPPFMAAFVAATVSRPERGGDAHGLAPFTAVRPLTNTQLIAAKLKASMRSTLATWVLVLIAIPIALRWSGTSSAVTDVAHHFAEALGAPRAIALGLLFLMALVLSTWKQLVQSLYVDMTGNEKLVKANVFVWLVLLAVGFPMLLWIRDKTSVIALLWNGFPFIVGVLVVIKTLMAAWTIVRLDERRLVTDRGLLIIAACWAASVFALYGVLVLIFPEMFPRYLLALIAILVIPLVRVAAIPLALARNRHR